MNLKKAAFVCTLLAGICMPYNLEAAISQKSLTAVPQNRKGGEGVAPLPLPATPLRRTERKRSPKPPVLIGEVVYTLEAGEASRSLKYYMQSVNTALNTAFSTGKVNISQFSFDPAETPVLYFTGETAFEFSAANRIKLAEFLSSGGYIIFDAAENSEQFRKSALEELSLMLPEKQVRKLPSDHPLFFCLYDLQKVSYEDKSGIKKSTPEILGINLGCRTSVFVTTKDLDCAWDGPSDRAFMRIQTDDARKLALNMSAYMISETPYGRRWSIKTIFEEKVERNAVTIPTIVYRGEWDPQGGLQELFRYAYTETTFLPGFKEANIKADSEKIFNYPLVYMSGLSSFKFSEPEIRNLKNYFAKGGIMIADATAGRQEFDISFRELMKQVFPDNPLRVLPEDHPVFSCFKEIKSVDYNEMMQAKGFKSGKPTLEAIASEKGVSVFYSKYDLGTNWSRNTLAYELGLAEKSSLDIGLNMLVYSTTH